MVLVVGATGLLGSELCLRLKNRGESVRALVRPTSPESRIAVLKSAGIELRVGDLKDVSSIIDACQGIDAVISTASSTFSRQPGDSIETVDAIGQLALVTAAKDQNVDRFLLVSFPKPENLSFPLADAKQQVERAIESMNFTVVRASFFMEAWLSPALGFDYVNGAVRICGDGTKPISWVSYRDVAEFCAIALGARSTERRAIEFGGPEPLSPLEVVRIFEKRLNKPFQLEHIPESVLSAQFEGATDSLQKSFAALMLGAAQGGAIAMDGVDRLGVKLTSVDEYAAGVALAAAASA